MSDWRALQRELAAWRDSDRVATFWWRDDDAVDESPALERLLALAARYAVPLHLAVIPARATDALAAGLARAGGWVAVLQHGFAHANHAPEGQKPMELGPHRPGVAICEDLARGRAMLDARFGRQAVPVLVPPWNRIANGLVPELAGLGFRGLSGHTPRAAFSPAPGLFACNTHLDVLRWRPERKFLGEGEALDLLIGHLRARRRGSDGAPAAGAGGTEPDEPSGLLTHHLVLDEAAWAFVGRLLAVLADHPAARWVTLEEAIPLRAGAGANS